MIKSIMPSLSDVRSPSKVNTDIHNRETNQNDTNAAALEFSKMFLTSVFKQMLNEEESSSLYGDSYGGQMWKSLYIEEIAKVSANNIGIKEIFEKSIEKKTNPYQSNEKNSAFKRTEIFA
ncbi:MAG: hypothetical protein HEEMFOPI_00428 [Holosporales bacterium]